MADKRNKKSHKPERDMSDDDTVQVDVDTSDVVIKRGRPSLKPGPYDVLEEDPGHDEGNLESNPKIVPEALEQ